MQISKDVVHGYRSTIIADVSHADRAPEIMKKRTLALYCWPLSHSFMKNIVLASLLLTVPSLAFAASSGYCCRAANGGNPTCEANVTSASCRASTGIFANDKGTCEVICRTRVLPSATYKDPVLTNFSSFANPPFVDTSFADLKGKAAAEMFRRKIIQGYEDGRFHGADLVTRAQAAKILLLLRYGNVKEMNNSNMFKDVKGKQWYVKFVMTAAEKGIIKGYKDGTFRPDAPVNTVEFLKMLAITVNLDKNLNYDKTTVNFVSDYKDVPLHTWYTNYGQFAYEYELFPDRGKTLSPEKQMTRNDVVVALYQFLKNRQ